MDLVIRSDEYPEGFWQSAECPTCGALVNEYCMYNDERVAHTRHSQRDRAVLAAARTRALDPTLMGTPVRGPRRRKK